MLKLLTTTPNKPQVIDVKSSISPKKGQKAPKMFKKPQVIYRYKGSIYYYTYLGLIGAY